MWIKTQRGKLANLSCARSVEWWKNFKPDCRRGFIPWDDEDAIESVEVLARFPDDVSKVLGVYDDMKMAHAAIGMIVNALEYGDGIGPVAVFTMPTAEHMREIREGNRRVFGDDNESLPAQ